MYIGLNIKYLRNIKNLTLKQLSAILNISDSAIGNYENNKYFPDANVIISICSYFGTDPNTLLLCDMKAQNIQSGTASISEILAHSSQNTGSNDPEIAALRAIIQNHESYIAALRATISDKNKIIALLEGSGAKQSK